MRHTHPLLRGFVLALAFTLMMIFWGTPALAERTTFSAIDKSLLTFAGMAVFGALIAALPERLKRLHGPWRKAKLHDCVLAFTGGLMAMLGLQMAGCGDLALMCGVLQGGLSALAFAGCAWITALLTVKLTGRWYA